MNNIRVFQTSSSFKLYNNCMNVAICIRLRVQNKERSWELKWINLLCNILGSIFFVIFFVIFFLIFFVIFFVSFFLIFFHLETEGINLHNNCKKWNLWRFVAKLTSVAKPCFLGKSFLYTGNILVLLLKDYPFYPYILDVHRMVLLI